MTVSDLDRGQRTESRIALRMPAREDGAGIHALIRDCDPLDENSMYCNLLQCDHFRDSCVVAEMDGRIVGWISAYVMPNDPETLFVWQVAVDEAARGTGLARKMLTHLLERDICRGVRRLQTTITTDNAASWGLFSRIADHVGGTLDSQAYFRQDDHFRGEHATEHLVTIRVSDALTLVA